MRFYIRQFPDDITRLHFNRFLKKIAGNRLGNLYEAEDGTEIPFEHIVLAPAGEIPTTPNLLPELTEAKRLISGLLEIYAKYGEMLKRQIKAEGGTAIRDAGLLFRQCIEFIQREEVIGNE